MMQNLDGGDNGLKRTVTPTRQAAAALRDAVGEIQATAQRRYAALVRSVTDGIVPDAQEAHADISAAGKTFDDLDRDVDRLVKARQIDAQRRQEEELGATVRDRSRDHQAAKTAYDAAIEALHAHHRPILHAAEAARSRASSACQRAEQLRRDLVSMGPIIGLEQ